MVVTAAARPILLVHGGAGATRATHHQLRALREALATGGTILRRRGSALDAVEAAVRLLEAGGLFNAGLGSRLQLDGTARMDAALMEGARLKTGAVANLEGIRHPIVAARAVMDRTPHVLLVGPSAGAFAIRLRLPAAPPPDPAKLRQVEAARRRLPRRWRHFSTVGAVARDRAGHLAAACSTGGVAVMLPGRVGDTPLVGCGLYADDRGAAVAITGLGEGIIRLAVAKEISLLVELGLEPREAGRLALRRLRRRVRGQAGALILDRAGRFAILHTTRHMAAGCLVIGRRPVISDHFDRIR